MTMAIPSLLGQGPVVVFAVVLAIVLLLAQIFAYLFSRPPFPKNAPPRSKESWPIVGAMVFFRERWSFYQRAQRESKSRHFSFYVGQNPVVGLCAVEEATRKMFFDTKALSAAEAYAVLLAGVPSVKKNVVVNAGDTHVDLTDKDVKFRHRMITMMKREKLAEAVQWMLKDTRLAFEQLAADAKGVTDPFQSIYRIVFQLTVRLAACNEIADDPKVRENVLYYFERIAGATSPFMIMYPWMPSWGKLKRTYAGARIYMIFKKIMDARKATEHKANDTLQMLMDMGDQVIDVIEFVLSALFAGQANTGIQGAWILTQLTRNKEWRERVHDEVVAAANKYCPDQSLSLADKLMHIPFSGWEEDFPMTYLCLKEVMRLGLPGTIFRKNVGIHDIPIPGTGGEQVIPPDTYVAMHVLDAHLNPDIWDEPSKWDPSRYLPERAEDQRQAYLWMGWGHGRHPCLGTKFARLEINMLVAFWFAYFPKYELTDASGTTVDDVPPFNVNQVGTHRPDRKVYLKYQKVLSEAEK